MKIELDTVVDPLSEGLKTADVVQSMIEDYPDVTFRIVTEHGPGGGHPVIRYRGPRAQVAAMVRKHYGADALNALADQERAALSY